MRVFVTAVIAVTLESSVRALWAALVIALALTLTPAPVGAADSTVTTSGMSFVPRDITLTEGDGLLHHNADAFDHNVRSVDKGADGAPLFGGATIATQETTRVE